MLSKTRKIILIPLKYSLRFLRIAFRALPIKKKQKKTCKSFTIVRIYRTSFVDPARFVISGFDCNCIVLYLNSGQISRYRGVRYFRDFTIYYVTYTILCYLSRKDIALHKTI